MKTYANRLELSPIAPGRQTRSKTKTSTKSKSDAIENPRAAASRLSSKSNPAVAVMVELPGEPQGKGRPRFTRRGFAYTPKKTRAYEAALSAAARKAMAGCTPMEGPVSVTVKAYMPVRPSWPKAKREAALRGMVLPTTRPDWENIAKVCDAFNGIVWTDDSQVVEGHVFKRYSESPRLEVFVYCFAEPVTRGTHDNSDSPPTRPARSGDTDRLETAAQSGRG